MADLGSTPDADTGKASTTRTGLFAREPVVTANLLAALVLELCVLLRAFGLPITDDQQNAINGLAGILVTIGAAIIARRFTTPLAAPRNNLGEPLREQNHPNGGNHPMGEPPATG